MSEVRPVFWRLTAFKDGEEVVVNPFRVARLVPISKAEPHHGTVLEYHDSGPGVMVVLVRETIEQILGEVS